MLQGLCIRYVREKSSEICSVLMLRGAQALWDISVSLPLTNQPNAERIF